MYTMFRKEKNIIFIVELPMKFQSWLQALDCICPSCNPWITSPWTQRPGSQVLVHSGQKTPSSGSEGGSFCEAGCQEAELGKWYSNISGDREMSSQIMKCFLEHLFCVQFFQSVVQAKNVFFQSRATGLDTRVQFVLCFIVAFAINLRV